MKQAIYSDLDKNILLRGGYFTVIEKNAIFNFLLPSYDDMKEDINFLYFFLVPLDKLQKEFFIKAETRLEFILKMLRMQKYDNFTVQLVGGFAKYIKNFEYADVALEGNGFPISEQVFGFFEMGLLVATGYRTYKNYQDFKEEQAMTTEKDAEELEFERKRKEAERKIQELRKKTAGKGTGTGITDFLYHEVLVIAAEFKYPIESIHSKTVFAINELYRVCTLMAGDRISAYAFGSGNITKGAKYKYLDEV